MRRKLFFQQMTAVCMAAAMCAGLTACQSTPKETEAVTEAETEPVTEAGPEPGSYQVTEENENQELVMNNQPESSYWFPQQLLEWTPEEDPDFEYNISKVPLAQRMDRSELTPVNATQNTDTEVMAISIMNSSTSGNAPRGLNKVNANTFSYWQYVDKLVYWGGSSGEGLIVAPSPDVTDMGHKNGVPVIGTVFFPQSAHGGKMEWLDTFLQKDADGNFPIVDKLVEVATSYGFDGWFINQESEGTEDEPLTKEHAELMREFIAAFKAAAPELELVYYDSMTNEGEMDWQNALTDKNDIYMTADGDDAAADSMFLNFWWTDDELAADELLKASAEKAEEIGISPYALYAGVDVQAEGYVTPIKWNLFESGENSTYTSLGIYCPSWAYESSKDSGLDDFMSKETALWVNSASDPTAEVEFSSDTQWRGVSRYVTERTAITALPFVTNFSLGNGYSFFREGENISKLDWNNRSIADILPTYRWIMEHEGENTLSATFDVANAYYGGNSLKFRGNIGKDTASVIKLYSADLPVEEDVIFTTVAKASNETALDAVLTFDDGSEETITGDVKVGTDWTKVTYDVSGFAGKKIRTISYKLSAAEDVTGYELYLGNISVYTESNIQTAKVTGVTVDESEFDEDAMYAGVRLSWETEGDTAYYEVYRINQDKTKSLLGVTNVNNFYINTLPRTDETNKSEFEVVPVSLLQEQGEGASATMDWPNNSLPKANFTASRTLIAPGEEVTFTSTCSDNTKEVAWTLTGAAEESATGDSVTAKYEAEGVYDVTVKATNDEGEAEKAVTGCIVVTSELNAGDELTLLSGGKATEATAYVNDNEAPQFAVDGDVTKKWCATGTPPHELTIDLGGVYKIGQVGISHAEAGGEGSDMNTKAYTISVSADGAEWTEVVSVTRNTLGQTMDTFAPIDAQFVKLSVIKPTQGSDTAARIYEVEVYGIGDAAAAAQTVEPTSEEAESEAETEAVTEAETEEVTEAVTEAETEAVTEAVAEAETEAVTEAETEAVTEAQTEEVTE